MDERSMMSQVSWRNSLIPSTIFNEGSDPIECTNHSTDAKVVCKAKGRAITFLNPKRRPVTRYLIDDCARLRTSLSQSNTKLCDFLVVDSRCDEHYVELKGKHVEHALRQLEATIPQ